jgi:hypothetical protein
MIELLKLEYIKIKSYTVFWIIFSIITALFLFTGIGVGNLDLKINLFYSSGIDLSNYLNFPNVWTTYAWIAGWYSHLWALLMIVLVGNEFNFRMMRQQVIFGIKRKDLLTSKIVLILVLPLVMLILMISLSLIFGFVHTQDISFSQIFQNTYSLLFYYIQSVAVMSFALMIVLLLRSTGLSVIIYIGYNIAEILIRTLLSLKIKNIQYFFPIKSINTLTPRPSIEIAMSDTLQQQLPITDSPMQYTPVESMLIVLAYLGIFWLLSNMMVMKRDL